MIIKHVCKLTPVGRMEGWNIIYYTIILGDGQSFSSSTTLIRYIIEPFSGTEKYAAILLIVNVKNPDYYITC